MIADWEASAARYLAHHRGDAVAVETEDTGLRHGAYGNDGEEVLVVHGISALLSGEAEAADQHWQQAASGHANAFAFELPRLLHPVPRRPLRRGVPSIRRRAGRIRWYVGAQR